MTRLTKRDGLQVRYIPADCQEAPGVPVALLSVSAVDAALQRLADYEDTGLEPGEICAGGAVWHEVVRRPLTAEEKRAYRKLGVPEEALPPYLLDCDLPEDGAAVLIALPGGQVCLDTCEVELDEQLDEFVFGLLHNGEWDDVAAWAFVPEWRG